MHGFLRLLLLFILAPCTLISQTSLKEKLQNADDLTEISQIVDQHYTDLAAMGIGRLPGEPRLKHWKRWEWYLSNRLGPDGEYVNIAKRLMEEKALLDRRGFDERSSESDWTLVGPSTSSYVHPGGLNGLGRVDRIAFHPNTPSVIYAGTPAGGLWRSSDDGQTWEPLTDFIPSLGISGIVVSHDSPNTIYILTGDGDSDLTGGFVKNFGYLRPSVGVLKSINGGVSWTQTGPLYQGFNTYVGYKLVQDPNNALVLFATTSVGLYRTTNGGATWEQVRNGRHYDVEFKPGSSSTIYTTTSANFYYSNDGGENWMVPDFDVPICCFGRKEIGVSPHLDYVVYILAGPATDTAEFTGLYLSGNSGQDFTQIRNTPNILGGASNGNSSDDQSTYDLAIGVSPADANTIITGGIILWRSTSSGVNMENASTYGEEGDTTGYVHPDIHDIAYNPLNGNVYVAGDGGLYKSSNDGVDWVNISHGIEVTQSYHMAGTAVNFNKVLIGNQDNGIKLRVNNSPDFPHVTGGDGFDVAFMANTSTGFYATINKGVRRFTNNGENSSWITPIPDGGSWFSTLATHPTDQDIVMVGTATSYISFNKGDTWDTLDIKATWDLETCPSHINRIYAAGGGSYLPSFAPQVARSDDLGQTWEIISDNPGYTEDSYHKVTDIAVQPDNSNHIIAVYGGFDSGLKVYRSTNAGDTWTNFSGSIPNIPVNCAGIDDNGDMYIGTDLGVFYRGATMSDWIPFSNHLPVVPVTDIKIYNNVLRVSTFGRGVWQSPLAGTCSIAISLTSDLEGDKYYQASSAILSSSTLKGGIGTDISFKAGNYVRLDPGFTAGSGHEFKAYTGPCLQGGIPD